MTPNANHMSAAADRPVSNVVPLTTGGGVVVNDLHSKLNPTVVDRIVEVRSVDDARAAILAARDAGRPICVSGGRHAMGRQIVLAAPELRRRIPARATPN